jgi:hypothetical protein
VEFCVLGPQDAGIYDVARRPLPAVRGTVGLGGAQGINPGRLRRGQNPPRQVRIRLVTVTDKLSPLEISKPVSPVELRNLINSRIVTVFITVIDIVSLR